VHFFVIGPVTHDQVRHVLLSCCRRQPKDRAAQRNRPTPCPYNAAAAARGFHAAASFLPLQLYDLIPFLHVPLSCMCESAGVWRGVVPTACASPWYRRRARVLPTARTAKTPRNIWRLRDSSNRGRVLFTRFWVGMRWV
jgi:hypothetical protein